MPPNDVYGPPVICTKGLSPFPSHTLSIYRPNHTINQHYYTSKQTKAQKMASQHLTFLSIASLLILSSQTLLAQTPSAPPPDSSGLPNVTGILDKAGQYKILIRLMGKNQLATQLENQLNTSTQGLTLLAPTDNAFDNLPSGIILNNLSDEEQVELILYHVLTHYYALTDFTTISNPVRTQYQDGLNFTSQGSQLNVSSGLVETQINNALRQEFPLAVYQVDKVLLPNSLFGAKPPASPPPPPTPASSGSNKTSEADGPSTDKNNGSGSGPANVGMGLLVVFVALHGSFLLS